MRHVSLETAVVPAAPLRPARMRLAAVAGAGAAALVIGRAGASGWDLVAAGGAAAVAWVAVIDAETRLLPNRILLPSTALLLIGSAVFDSSHLLVHLAAAVAAGGAFFVAAAIRPGSLGMGDAKLALLLGALLGRAVAGAIVIGFLLVALPAIVLALREGRQALKRQLPLGPFLALGAVVAIAIAGV
jgi:prepilin signal peptidase PulO-like enzyme (type II secretory pathway)